MQWLEEPSPDKQFSSYAHACKWCKTRKTAEENYINVQNSNNNTTLDTDRGQLAERKPVAQATCLSGGIFSLCCLVSLLILWSLWSEVAPQSRQPLLRPMAAAEPHSKAGLQQLAVLGTKASGRNRPSRALLSLDLLIWTPIGYFYFPFHWPLLAFREQALFLFCQQKSKSSVLIWWHNLSGRRHGKQCHFQNDKGSNFAFQ